MEEENLRQFLHELANELRQVHRSDLPDDVKASAENMAAFLVLLANRQSLPEPETIETFVGAAKKMLRRFRSTH